jgi:benzoyl-CoA reductase/2-hydroxyglutaryl-CoA dehydratase subunit BcrC/BadD/HgdB
MNNILQKIEKFKSDELEALKEYKEAGGKVAALFNRLFPPSLLYGLGIRPIRILSGADLDAENASEKLIRPDACPFCKSIIGNFLTNSLLYQHVDIVVGLIACDQMRRTLERITADIKLPVFPLQMPGTISTEAKNYYISGVSETVENISSFLDRKLDYDIVRKTEQARVASVTILAGLFRDGATDPVILHALSILFGWARPEEFHTFLENIVEELPVFEPRKKVVVVGSIMCEEDDAVIKLLSRHNIFPLLLTSNGLNACEGLKDVNSFPDNEIIKKLAEITFSMPAGIRSRPNTRVYERIGEYLTSSNASGIILKTLLFCDLWYTEKIRMKQSFDVPLLVLNSGFGEGMEGTTATRIEAFVETLP